MKQFPNPLRAASHTFSKKRICLLYDVGACTKENKLEKETCCITIVIRGVMVGNGRGGISEVIVEVLTGF